MKSFLIPILFLSMLTAHLQGRFHVVKRADQLEKVVDSYAYSIVCFAPASKFEGEHLELEDKKDRKKEFKLLEDLVKAASKRPAYKDYLSKDVGFVVVDTSAQQSYGLAQDYNLSDYPTCFVYEQGQPHAQRKIIRPASPRDILKLIEAVGGQDLQQILKDRKTQAELQRQERIAQYYAYAAYYPYWWDYGWYPYRRSPYWGGRWGLYAGW